MSAIAGRVLLIPKGAYNALTTYNPLDFVTYGANSYVCKQTSTGNAPTNTTYWQLMAQGATDADHISYDGTASGLASTDVQGAIDEVVSDTNDALSAITNVYNAKNLLPNEAVSQIQGNATLTVYSDGHLYLTTNGANFNQNQFYAVLAEISLKAGQYLITGWENASNTGADIAVYDMDTGFYVWSSEHGSASFNPTDSHKYQISLVSSYQSFEPIDVTFYPMIRDSRIPDATYVPFCPTNRQLLSYKDNGVVGCKNIMPNTVQSGSNDRMSWTRNADGSIYLSSNGQVYSGAQTILNLGELIPPVTGQYILSGGLRNYVGIAMYDYNTGGWTNFYENRDFVITLETTHKYLFVISVAVHADTGVVNDTIYPMLRLATDTDPTYQPFSKTNQALTNDKAERTDLSDIIINGTTNNTGSTITTGTYFYLNGVFCRALADVANGATFTLNTNYKAINLNTAGEWRNITSQCTWANTSDLYSYDVFDNGKMYAIHLTVRAASPFLTSWTTVVTLPKQVTSVYIQEVYGDGGSGIPDETAHGRFVGEGNYVKVYCPTGHYYNGCLLLPHY